MESIMRLTIRFALEALKTYWVSEVPLFEQIKTFSLPIITNKFAGGGIWGKILFDF
jgi:hypothetical protein